MSERNGTVLLKIAAGRTPGLSAIAIHQLAGAAKRAVRDRAVAMIAGVIARCRLVSPGRRKPGSPRRILAVRVDHIGDALLTTPALAMLRRLFPAADITLACGSWGAQIFDGNPNVDRLLVVDCPWWVRKRSGRSAWHHWARLLRVVAALRRSQFDLMVDFRGDPRHVIWFGVLAGIPCLAGIDRLGTGPLLDVPAKPANDDHEIDRSISVVRALGGEGPAPAAFIPIIDRQRRAAARFGAVGTRLIVIHPGAKPVNRWPIDRFITLVRSLLVRPEVSFVVIGGPEDAASAAMICELDPQRIHNAVTRLDIPGVAALVERATLYIGADSGPMHLLHAFAVPAVLLFGPTRATRFAPRGADIHIVAAAHCCAHDLHEVCALRQSGEWSACMEDVSVERVSLAVERILDGPRKSDHEGRPTSHRDHLDTAAS